MSESPSDRAVACVFDAFVRQLMLWTLLNSLCRMDRVWLSYTITDQQSFTSRLGGWRSYQVLPLSERMPLESKEASGYL